MGIAARANQAPTTEKQAQRFLLDMGAMPGTAQFELRLTGVSSDDVAGAPRYTMTVVPVKNHKTGVTVIKGTEYPEMRIVLDFSMSNGMQNVDEGAGASKTNVLYFGGASDDPEEETLAFVVLRDYLGSAVLDKDGNLAEWVPGHFGWNGEEGPKFAAVGSAVGTIAIGKPNEMRGQAGRYYMPQHKITDLDPMPSKEEMAAAAAAKKATLGALFRKQPDSAASSEASTDAKPDSKQPDSAVSEKGTKRGGK